MNIEYLEKEMEACTIALGAVNNFFDTDAYKSLDRRTQALYEAKLGMLMSYQILLAELITSKTNNTICNA